MRAIALSLCAAAAASYVVHKDCAEHAREAAWARTVCGSYTTNPPTSDQITQWGSTVTPVGVLQEYPRPQMTRPATTYKNLNGLWEFQLGSGFAEAVPFGQTLNQTILVPFPLESCLSGAFRWPAYSKFLWYRLLFDAPFSSGNTLLHFGAVDWNTTVYLNGKMLGNHLGGYDGVSFDLTSGLLPTNNELILAVYDPSDDGFQVEGKQRISAITHPGGDTYTPSSGVWQTVWLENVPTYSISSLAVRGDTANVYLTVNAGPGTVSGAVSFAGAQVATFSGATGAEIVVAIPSPKLWGPLMPNLYDISVTATATGSGATDTVGSYVGMRSVGTVSFPVPPTPASGPRIGYDNSGGDMPGQPTTLAQPDFNLCWAACNSTPGCAAWSYGVQGAGCESKPLCWLKESVESWSQTNCRIAGDQGTPGGHALRPAINGSEFSCPHSRDNPVFTPLLLYLTSLPPPTDFTFLAGWLDQSWWPDGEYTAPTDDALAFDVQAVVDFGLNVIRLHQKVRRGRGAAQPPATLSASRVRAGRVRGDRLASSHPQCR